MKSNVNIETQQTHKPFYTFEEMGRFAIGVAAFLDLGLLTFIAVHAIAAF